MKTRLKKIIIGAAAILFVMTGVSFAHDGGVRHHKPHGKAHGFYKEKKYHHHRDHRHYKASKRYRKGHTYQGSHHRHYYEKNHRRWKKSHANYRRSHHDRYRHRKIQRHHHDSHRRRTPREDLIYKIALKDPRILFKVILKEH